MVVVSTIFDSVLSTIWIKQARLIGNTLVMKQVKRAIYEQIFNLRGWRFEKIFHVANRTYLKWPIVVKYSVHDNLYIITDKNGFKILVGRPERVPFYRHGIKLRLDNLSNEYLLSHIDFNDDDIVVDVGANIGEVSFNLARIYNSKVICIEPDDLEFKCLQRNCGEYNSVFLDTPLWSEEKEMTFYQKNSTGDSSLFEIDSHLETKTVRTSTLSKVITKNVSSKKRVRLLKLEAEGAEPEILLGGLDVLHRIDYITADVGPERGLKQESTQVGVESILLKNGFHLIRSGTKRQVLLFKNSAV